VARRAPLALKPLQPGADQQSMVIVLRLYLGVFACLSAMGVLMYLPHH
jgi:hypothetical protein